MHTKSLSWNLEGKRWLFPVLCFILTCVEGETVYKNKVGGFEFNGVRKIYNGKEHNLKHERNRFLHIQEDDFHSNSILLANGFAIYSLDLTSQKSSLLAGSVTTPGYAEGGPTISKFSYISGLVTSSIKYPRNILVADATNYCLRNINRETNETSTFGGKCTIRGNINGQLKNAQFGAIAGIVKEHSRSNIAFIYDNTYRILKKILIVSSTVENVMNSNFIANGMHLHIFTKNLYHYSNTEIHQYDLKKRKLDNLFGLIGYEDGFFNETQFLKISDVVFISGEVAVIADVGSGGLRVLNLEMEETTSICIHNNSREVEFKEGNITGCKISAPQALLFSPEEDQLLILGESEIYKLEFNFTGNDKTDQLPSRASPAESKVEENRKKFIFNDDMLIGIFATLVCLTMIIGLVVYNFTQQNQQENEEERPSSELSLPTAFSKNTIYSRKSSNISKRVGSQMARSFHLRKFLDTDVGSSQPSRNFTQSASNRTQWGSFQGGLRPSNLTRSTLEQTNLHLKLSADQQLSSNAQFTPQTSTYGKDPRQEI